MDVIDFGVAGSLALGVGSNLLTSAGRYSISRIKEATLWLLRLERDPAKLARIENETHDHIAELAAAYEEDAASNWTTDRFGELVERKNRFWAAPIFREYLMNHGAAFEDFKAFKAHGMQTAMDFDVMTVYGNVATVHGKGAIGNVGGSASITVNNY
ncbi:hypothetical protein [Streptomyces sp. NPDC056069]|uniref:hypothetical protein n=1 Tax=Streptomyces sp. NPDC056069 TaxID=3345702 RepID=UPI0035D57BAE